MKKNWNTQDIPDQSGKIHIITGGNSGLGFSSAQALAAKGAHVVMASRNLTKGQKAVDEIKTQVPKATVSLIKLDVSDLESVKAFAGEIKERFDHVDVLMNNAGIMATPYAKSKQGFEAQFATNHLGHFALTGHLLDLLKKAPQGGRVVSISSMAARSGKMNFADLQSEKSYSPWKAYGQSKLANQLFIYALQRRLQEAGISNVMAVAAHPGGSNTNLADATKMPKLLKGILMPLMSAMMQSADMGALPQLYAAVDPEAEPGGYYGPDRMNEVKGYPTKAKVPNQAKSTADQDELWKVSEELTQVHYTF